jgi:hypothetical protein
MLSRYKEKDGVDLTKQISIPAKLVRFSVLTWNDPAHIFNGNLSKE